jgi:hypothetical protein
MIGDVLGGTLGDVLGLGIRRCASASLVASLKILMLTQVAVCLSQSRNAALAFSS